MDKTKSADFGEKLYVNFSEKYIRARYLDGYGEHEREHTVIALPKTSGYYGYAIDTASRVRPATVPDKETGERVPKDGVMCVALFENVDYKLIKGNQFGNYFSPSGSVKLTGKELKAEMESWKSRAMEEAADGPEKGPRL